MGRPKVHDDALRERAARPCRRARLRRGADALSLRRLAADAGTSTTAVYSLFGNKAGLLDSLYQEAARRFGARLAQVEATDDPLRDIVAARRCLSGLRAAASRISTRIMFAQLDEQDEDGRR